MVFKNNWIVIDWSPKLESQNLARLLGLVSLFSWAFLFVVYNVLFQFTELSLIISFLLFGPPIAFSVWYLVDHQMKGHWLRVFGIGFTILSWILGVYLSSP